VEYDSFGNLVSDSNPSFELPFGFAGGLADATTGLVRFGFRDYDPAAGRWTAKDPVLFDGGQGNLYVYVGSNPISLRDPLGLWCFGGSFYATLGGGAQYCLDREKGFSLCVEAGLGVGGDVNLSGGSIPDADEIGFEFNPTCFGVGGTLACGFKICNGTATWQCSTEGEAGPDFEQVKFNGESTGVKFNVGAPDLEFGRCKVQAKLYAKKCFVKRF
jgi:RHS repeat-associated protein